METIAVKLPQSAIHTLALQAHEKGVTLNDYIVVVVANEAKRVIEENLGG